MNPCSLDKLRKKHLTSTNDKTGVRTTEPDRYLNSNPSVEQSFKKAFFGIILNQPNASCRWVAISCSRWRSLTLHSVEEVGTSTRVLPHPVRIRLCSPIIWTAREFTAGPPPGATSSGMRTGTSNVAKRGESRLDRWQSAGRYGGPGSARSSAIISKEDAEGTFITKISTGDIKEGADGETVETGGTDGGILSNNTNKGIRCNK